MLWIGGTVAFLPSCVYKQDQVHIQLKHLQVGPGQEKLLASAADEIIPSTDTPGASDLGLHLFALKMIDDCYDQQGREAFQQGLKAFAAKKESDEKWNLQAAMNDPAMEPFAKTWRSLIIRGYTQSEYYMTKLVPYQLIPGGYRGCVPVKAKANA